MLEFGVLGYLTVHADDLDIDLPGVRRRAVLVRLLMAGGHPLSAIQLADDAWDGSPPKAGLATLQSHISFLRKTIPGLAVRSVGGGYILDTRDAVLDSVQFERDLQDAQANRGNPQRTETLLARALGRWRGAALADVAGASWALGETARLEQLRIGALESWLTTLIQMGRAAEAVAEAEAAVEAAPLSDGLWASLMVALYRSGRQAEALRAYQKLRGSLAEAGLEPSAKLVDLEEAIARGDRELPGAEGENFKTEHTYQTELAATAGNDVQLQTLDLHEVTNNPVNEISNSLGEATAGKRPASPVEQTAGPGQVGTSHSVGPNDLPATHGIDTGIPTGTVTLMFTDIQGSTRLWDQHPSAMAEALERHDALIRSAIESSGGYVFKTVGDAFHGAFASALAAVLAAGEAQRVLHAESWPDEVTIRVRMALHTGECEERDGDYFGPVLNRIARLEATAHGGQVVVSRSTAEVVRDRLPSGMTLVELGSHPLKDLERPEEIFQLAVDGVPADFPPLRADVGAEITTNLANPTNLTQPVSSFVGRDTEVADVVKLLGQNRLVTLTGSGGVGKTRLATEVGRAVLPNRPDGVWLSELAAVTDSALVASEVLSDLGIAEQAGREALDTLVEVLSTQGRLIILDNCEQVLDGCAALADTVVRSCPEIRLLSTSREPLRIEGEVIYRVPSLSLPPEQVDNPTDLVGSGAVALFVERASAQAVGLKLTDDDARLVAAICRRLDGLPLALELATARLRSMSLTKLHDRLEQRFGLLTGGSRVALARQQTLKATVDWSFDLLTDPERALFRRTSVFVDGFDLEAAEGVCALEDIPDSDVADLLASLVDKSLVVAEPHNDDVRYRLQETLRQYGADRLAEAGASVGGTNEADRLASAHADYYMRFAELAAPHLEGRSYGQWLGRLDADHLNFRAAITHALARSEWTDRVLDQFWSLRRYWRDARQPAQSLALLEQALAELGPNDEPGRWARALFCKATLLRPLDHRLALATISSAPDYARQAENASLEAEVLSRYARSLSENGSDEVALVAGAEAVALARQINNPVLLGLVLQLYADVLDEAGDKGAEGFYLEALALTEHSGDIQTERSLHNNYALVLIEQGNVTEARRHLGKALHQAGNKLIAQTAMIYNNLGWILLREGETQQSSSYLSAVLRSARLDGKPWILPYSVLGLACCAAQLGAAERAALLHGGADALLSASSDRWEIFEGKFRERDIALLRERLGNDFEHLYAEGLTMPHDEVIKRALAGN